MPEIRSDFRLCDEKRKKKKRKKLGTGAKLGWFARLNVLVLQLDTKPTIDREREKMCVKLVLNVNVNTNAE